MFTYFLPLYLGYIDIAKVDSNSYLCSYSRRLKGTNHGYSFRHYYDYGGQGSDGPLDSLAFGCTSWVEGRSERNWRFAGTEDRTRHSESA